MLCRFLLVALFSNVVSFLQLQCFTFFARKMMWNIAQQYYCHNIYRTPQCLKTTKKVFTLRAKRATFTFRVDKSSSKMPKMARFGEFLKTWSLWSNSVTRHVNFNWTKIGEKCQNSNLQMRYWIEFPPILVLLKLTCLVTLFDHKLQIF